MVTTSLVRQIEMLFAGGSAAGLSDRQLLERFAAGRDEDAFAALVARHGPMVLGVCRQVLGDHQHAEDAFQAVFLVLARKAGSLHEPDLLGNWLYGVALRTARKARCRLARRRQSEDQGAASRPEACRVTQPEPLIERERAEALHREIDRLPAAFRRAVVLCYFEGLSPDEAAARLRWPRGTLRSRLVRAREKLRRGLLRRGVVLSGTGLAAMLAPRSASASVSSFLCDSTTRAAIAFAARHADPAGALAAPAAAMAREVLRSMLLHKLKLTALSLLLLASLATGAGWLAHSPAMKEGPVQEPAASKVRVAPPRADWPQPAAGRMAVTGRVLGPDGRPAAGVPVDIIATPRAPETEIDAERTPYVLLGRGAADAEGRFRIEAARGSSARFYDVFVLAGASGPGSAFGCVKLHPDDDRPAAEIQLPPDQVIRGRLVDIQGQPAAGVEVQLQGVYTESSKLQGVQFDSPVRAGRGYVWPAVPGELRPWPRPAVTDAQGRFAFGGVGRGLHVCLSIRDPRFAQQRFDLMAEDRDAGKEASPALHPAKIIEGRVLAEDTGRPVPDAAIAVRSSFGTFGPMFTTTFRADGQGRFQINPYAGDYFRLRVIPPDGLPNLAREAEFAWPKAAVKKEIDIPLPRGVLIRGTVSEEGTGRPVAGAGVRYFATGRRGDTVEGEVATKADGSFQAAVPPGKGHLLVMGPALDYIPREIAWELLYQSARRNRRLYAHAILAYEAKDGEAAHELKATLRPGKTVRGRVLGPAGQAVDGAIILARQQIDPRNLNWQGHSFIHIHDGRFELHGLEPDRARPAYFLDAEHEWGAAVELSGQQGGAELTVRLQPCGRARARFVGPDGKPVAGLNVTPYFQFVMTPGAPDRSSADGGARPVADEAFLPNIDFRHYPNGPSTDAEGRVTLPDLIPGATYRISDWSTANVPEKGVQLRKDFAVMPGETLDLGDILVEKPAE